MNEQVAALLREYAELTVITGGDVFRVRNYEKAARSIRGWPEDVGQLDLKALRAIPGVGASIAAKIAEFNSTGAIKALDELRAKIPAGVLELTRVPGLGPKRALQLSRELGVQSVDDLAAAIKAGRLDGLAGFGARSEERIAAGIEVYRQGRERVLLDVALRTATAMVTELTPLSQRCAYAGSLRRWRETIGDIDILAAADDSAPLMAAFAAQPDVVDVVGSGPTKTTVRTASGLTADLRVVPLDAWGAALQYFTGSAAHNVAIRQIAIKQKLKLSEYGLFDADTDERVAGRGGGLRAARA
jgi:DNA polymerase (family 10)